MSFGGKNFFLCWIIFHLSSGTATLTTRSGQANVRLTGGNSTAEGRLEVFHNGTWGSVCDDAWGSRDAKVACRSLGFPFVSRALDRRFGEGTGAILLDDVDCVGDELALSECPGLDWGVHDCSHSEDVGIICSETSREGRLRVRLMNGQVVSEGRVEVSDGDTWGTVCDDHWDYRDATVVCRSLGYPSGVSAGNSFPDGTGLINLDEVDCNGNEASLADCGHVGWGEHDCTHSEDAGVVCSNPSGSHGNLTLRLSDGSTSSEGRVEVFYYGQWGTVCDDWWDLSDATVVCRSLGYLRAVDASVMFGEGSGDIYLDDVNCIGSEVNIADCPHNGWGSHNCLHSEDAGVICSPESIFPDEIDVRLTQEGRVEVRAYNGTWGTVCGDGWDLAEATVVCRSLGYSQAVSASVQVGEWSDDIYLDDVVCSGEETTLADCSHAGWGVVDCQHGERAHAVCSETLGARDEMILEVGSVRLVGGNSSLEGRVEVYLPDQWGTICDDNWNLRDATVVCRQLGYSSVVSVHTKFGEGSGSILLDDVRCTGEEEELGDCHHAGWGHHDCSHSEDVGVICSNASTGNDTSTFPENDVSYRLFGGASANKGVLQVRSTANETWNTVCLDGASGPIISPIAAAGLCKLLGYGVYCGTDNMVSVGGVDGFPLKRGRVACSISLDEGVRCSLNTDLTTQRPCDIFEAVMLECDTDFELRLNHGYYDNMGMLQVRCPSSQQWKGICGNGWKDITRAQQVACRHLGFPNTTGISAYVVPRWALSTPMDTLIDSFTCSGNEDRLVQCIIQYSSLPPCASYAGLECRQEEPQLELKLVESSHEASGFLLGRSGPTDEWGALCQSSWDYRDAQVACRHLGFETSVPVLLKERHGIITTSTTSRRAVNSTFLTAVGCYGNEEDLTQCASVYDVIGECNDQLPYVECIAEIDRYAGEAYLCGEINYCGVECSRREELLSLQSCRCDEVCGFFGDCCYDYSVNCDPVSNWTGLHMNGVSIEHYACAFVPGNDPTEHPGFALVSICPAEWNGLQTVKQNCERVGTSDNVIEFLPVVDKEGASYKNIFCAICHGVSDTVDHWVVRKQLGTTRHYVVPPSGVVSNGTVRTCPVNTVRVCREEFQNTTLDTACQSYYAPLDVNGIRYHNPHCALCNGVSVTPTDTCSSGCSSCESPSDNWEECVAICGPGGYYPSIEVAFDFGWGGEEDSPCQPGQVFDQFTQTCRTLICVSGTTNQDGECIEAEDSPPSDWKPSGNWSSFLDDNCSEAVDRILGLDVSHWQVVAKQTLNSSSREFSLSLIAKPMESMRTPGGPLQRPLPGKYKSLLGFCNITSVTVFVSEGAALLSALPSCTNFTMPADDVFQTGRSENGSGLNFQVFRSLTWSSDRDQSYTGNTSAWQDCLEVLDLNCTLVELLSTEEYTVEDGGRAIKHLRTGEELGPGQFVIFQDGKVATCGLLTDTDGFALGMVSLVCCCLSLVALTATFLTYCIFPELRNIAGMYIMNLVVALFVVLLLLVLSWGLDFDGYACTASAAVVHWAWLTAFFWMAMLSYNAARTFGYHARLRRATGAFRRRLLAAMVLAWGGGLLIVAVCLVLNYCDCTSLPPIYSESQPCLIADADARLVVFGVPIAVSICISTVCLVVIIAGVRATKAEGKVLQKKEGQREEIMVELMIYTKLVLLFGTTWILAFLSDVINHVVFSYVNVIVNTLQGVFIFLAFCVNRRVRALWKKKLGWSSEEGESRARGQTSSANISASVHQRSCAHVHTNPNFSSEPNEEETKL